MSRAGTVLSPRARRLRRRGQHGFSLLEMLLVVTMSGVVLVPLLGWTIMALRADEQIRDASERTNGRNLLGAHLSDDVAQAGSVDPGGTDCAGGAHAGGTVLVAMATPASSPPVQRVVYSVALDDERVNAVWRRSCPAAGGTVAEIEVVRGVVAPVGGWAAAVTCSPRSALDGDVCGQVALRLTSRDGSTVSAIATKRVEGPR